MNVSHFSKKFTCFICITIISFIWCFGQNSNKSEYQHDWSENEFLWVNLGLGFSSVGGVLGGSFGINGSYQIRKSIFSLRFVHSKEMNLIFNVQDLDSNWDLGLLYGLNLRRTFGFVSMSAGISYVGLNIYENSEEMRYATVGLPIETQFFLTLKHIGFGIYGFANINSKSSFAGGLICIQLGKLR